MAALELIVAVLQGKPHGCFGTYCSSLAGKTTCLRVLVGHSSINDELTIGIENLSVYISNHPNYYC
jgi:hypothetical protein